MSHPLRSRIGMARLTAVAVATATLAFAPAIGRAGVVVPGPAGEVARQRPATAPSGNSTSPVPARNHPQIEWSGWDLSQPYGWTASGASAPGAEEVRAPAAASVERLRLPHLTEAETAAAAAIVEAEATGVWGGLPAPAAQRPPVAFMPDESPQPPAIPLPPAAWTGLSVLAGAGALAATRARRWLC